MRASPLLLAVLVACSRAGETVTPAPRPEPAPASRSAPVAADAPDTAPAPDTTDTPTAPSQPADPLASEAVAVVDRQHAAYNRHDLEGFLAAYADSVGIQRLGDTVVMTGKARLRESTAAWFTEAPEARTEVLQRMVLGPFVVDRQRVSGAPGTPPLEAIGIYEVREGLIRRVWSVPPPPTPR